MENIINISPISTTCDFPFLHLTPSPTTLVSDASRNLETTYSPNGHSATSCNNRSDLFNRIIMSPGNLSRAGSKDSLFSSHITVGSARKGTACGWNTHSPVTKLGSPVDAKIQSPVTGTSKMSSGNNRVLSPMECTKTEQSDSGYRTTPRSSRRHSYRNKVTSLASLKSVGSHRNILFQSVTDSKNGTGLDVCSKSYSDSVNRTPPDGEDTENVPPSILGIEQNSCTRRGQLKLSISCDRSQITVHVQQARHLKSKWTSRCSSFVEISLIPGENQPLCQTSTINDCNKPSFDEKFTVDMSSEDQKRLKVALYNTRDSSRVESLGCMTFGVKNLKASQKDVTGWYYLLNQGVGHHKHLRVPEHKESSTKSTTLSPNRSKSITSIPEVNRSLHGLDSHTLVVRRGRHGYGFTVMGSCPVTIGKVEEGSHSEASGLRKGDAVVRINGQNVSRSTADSVAKIVKNSSKQIILDIVRSAPLSSLKSVSDLSSAGYESMPLGCDALSLAYDTTSVDYEYALPSHGPFPTPASSCSSRSTVSRRCSPVGSTPGSVRRADDTLPLRPSQVDNTTTSSVHRRRKTPTFHDENDENSFMTATSTTSSVRRPRSCQSGSSSTSSRKSHKLSRKSAKHADTTLVSTTTANTTTSDAYDSLRWDATNEEIFFPEQHGEIYDGLPWKPFDCDVIKKGAAIQQEDTYATMCDADVADVTFLDVSMTDMDDTRISADNAHTTLPEVSFCDLSRRERARQAAAGQLLRAEAEFISQMQDGIQRYSRPLRHCILSAGEHRILFQNVEKLVAFSEYHMRQMAETSLAYTDLSTTENDERYVEVVGNVYRQRATILCEAYELYIQGLAESLRLLDDLSTYEQFHDFLGTPAPEAGEPTLEAFLRKPEEHLQTLMVTLRTVMSHTSSGHRDASALQRVVKAFSECCSKMAAPASNDTTTSSSTTNTSSTSFASSRRSGSSSGSKSSAASIDSELLEIQDRLVFPKDISTVQLATPARHVIYTGELLRVESCMWTRVVVILLSDLLLICRVEGDSLVVVEEPLPLPDVMSSEFGGSHPCEFTLTAEVQSNDNIGWEARHLLLRAPSMDQACTWKSLLQQRIASFRTHRELMAGRSREAIF